MHNILLVDDDPVICKAMKDFLEDEGFFLKVVHTGDEAVAHIRQRTLHFSLALVDYHLDKGVKGPSVIKAIREANARVPVIGFSCDEDDEPHNESLASGALMFVQKDTSDKKLLGIIHRACREGDRWQKPLDAPYSNEANSKIIQSVRIAGASAHLAENVRVALKYAVNDETVFIRGENGTGKEQFARIIHENSPRRLKPFIAINCGAINAGVMESELFGHVKGAFTGAMAGKVGKFEAANGGTIFLDEIGDMPPHLQVAVLRVLQQREITPVGSNVTRPIDIRIIAATNAPIEKNMENGLFRPDLHYRINVLPLTIAPLRDRPEDIPPLIYYFLEKLNAQSKQPKTILGFCVDELQKLPWPGNVRELENAITRMYALTDGPQIDEAALNLIAPIMTVLGKEVRILDHQILMIRHQQDERELILLTLNQSRHLNEGASRLGIGRSLLRSRMKALKIKNPFADREDSVK